MPATASLAELRRLRKEGKTRRQLEFDENGARIYDEYDDKEYEARQRERLRQDDFVVDDDGSGYVDNGEYEWDRPQYGDSDPEDAAPRGPKRKAASDERAAQNATVSSLFRAKKPKVQSARPVAAKNDELEAILSSIETAPRLKRTPKAGTAAPQTPALASKLSTGRQLAFGLRSGLGSRLGSSLGSRLGASGSPGAFNRLSSTPRATNETPTRHLRPDRAPEDESDMPDSSMLGSALIDEAPAVPAQDIKLEPVSLEMAQAQAPEEPEAEAEATSSEPLPLSEPEYITSQYEPLPLPTPDPVYMDSDDSDLEDVADAFQSNMTGTSSLPTPGPSSDNGPYEEAQENWPVVAVEAEPEPEQQKPVVVDLQPGSTLRMYWTDYLETPKTLVLFGRTTEGHSATAVVHGLARDLYFLPQSDKTTEDVTNELFDLFRSHGMQLRSRPVEMRDCFSQDKSPHTYLHVRAPYDGPLPSKVGRTYSTCHGLTSHMIESFLVGRRVMGPCWLDVTVKSVPNRLSWTDVAVECESPLKISVVADSDASKLGVPLLNIMSVGITTKQNANGSHEIISVTARTFKSVAHDTASDALMLPSTVVTGIRPPEIGAFNGEFKQGIQDHNQARTKSGQQQPAVVMHANERALLQWFFTLLQRADPDVFIGHSLTDLHLSTIFARALELKLPPSAWSGLGRLRQQRPPKEASQFELLRMCSGRLLCDLKNTFGVEVAQGRCSEYTLEEMVREFLSTKRKPFDPNVSSGDWLKRKAQGLMDIIRYSEVDTLYVASIAFKNQMLPLSRQLTNLAGNAWRATLRGTRSGRNDFLLMHEFTKAGWLVPDRRAYDRDQGDRKRGKKKYQGGMVFDPEKGLYQSCVLVMDFNSLYPSIIQEFNICFTTVDYNPADQETMPEVPSSDVSPGLLPKVLQNLVQRRQEVKKLMKNASASPAELAEWQIRQTALKLTANSMYGCLGLPESRFAAQPLAMLVTAKGRETLIRTKSLAEENSMRVLYGDTDSVMIHTNAVQYADAHAIGAEFKRLVNRQFRVIELDIDNVFRELMLYAKKKYAALIMHPDGSTKLEYKGLDLRRREFCDACKRASNEVLKRIFEIGDEVPEPLAIFERILEYLTGFASDMRAGKMPMKFFVMRNQLSKEVEKYDANLNLPQVRVAKARAAAGYSVKPKDVISYIISADETTKAYQERAVSPEDLKAQGLRPDYEWYLEHQIYRPMDRICECLEVYDSSRLAEALGVTVTKSAPRPVQQQYAGFESASLITLAPDAERFAGCEPVRLRHKDHSFECSGVASLDPHGFKCGECHELMEYEDVSLQVELALRAFVARYYENWLVCDECECLTRPVATYAARKCPQPRCKGSVHWQYDSQKLYTQMCYMQSLFDASKATKESRMAVLSQHNAKGLALVKSTVDRYVARSGYSHVNIGQYFAF